MPSNTHQNNITCQACPLIRPANTSISNRDTKQARQFTRTTRRRWCSSQVPPSLAWAAGGLSKTAIEVPCLLPTNASKINVMNEIAPHLPPSSASFPFPRPSLYSAGRRWSAAYGALDPWRGPAACLRCCNNLRISPSPSDVLHRRRASGVVGRYTPSMHMPHARGKGGGVDL